MNQFCNVDRPGAPQEVTIEWERETLDDECPDVSFLDADSGRYDDVADAEERARYMAEDEARLQDYGSSWWMIGIRAKATIQVPIGGNSFSVFTLTSSGLWGIESDSTEDYLASVFDEQCQELKACLETISRHVLSFQPA